MITQTFPSKREGGGHHIVTVEDDGRISCTCPGFTHQQKCWHVTEVAERLAMQKEGEQA